MDAKVLRRALSNSAVFALIACVDSPTTLVLENWNSTETVIVADGFTDFRFSYEWGGEEHYKLVNCSTNSEFCRQGIVDIRISRSEIVEQINSTSDPYLRIPYETQVANCLMLYRYQIPTGLFAIRCESRNSGPDNELFAGISDEEGRVVRQPWKIADIEDLLP